MLFFVSICSLHAEPSCVYYTDYLRNDLNIPELTKDIPHTIIYNYKQGKDCFVAGSILIGIGTALVLPGVFCMLGGETPKEKQIGTGLLYAGSTFVSVSIPLLCFCDHIKKDANMAYEVWDILDYEIDRK